MPPYQFRFAAVQRVREAHRDDARGQLAQAFEAVEKLESERVRLEKELAATRSRMASAAAASPLDVNQLLDAQRYELVVKNQLSDLGQKRRLVEAEVERRRGLVAAAEQQVKVMEKLDAAARREHTAAEARQESRAMDEVAGIQWTRSQAPTNPTEPAA